MAKRNDTGWWACWITPTGRSFFAKPRKLYEPDWGSAADDWLWDKGENDYVHRSAVGGFAQNRHGYTFTSRSKEEVALVISAAANLRTAIARDWGYDDGD